MIAPLLNVLERVVLEPTGRRFFLLAIMIAIGAATFAIFEWYTSYFELSRIEKTAEVLSKLQDLASKETTSSSGDTVLIRQLVDATHATLYERRFLPQLSRAQPSKLQSTWAFLAGMAPWLILAIVAAWTERREPETPRVVVLVLAVGLLMGWLGTSVAGIFFPWLTIAYAVLHFGLLGLLAWWAPQVSNADNAVVLRHPGSEEESAGPTDSGQPTSPG